MKPLVIYLIYNDETKNKAFEIYNLIKKNYRLYHEHKNKLITPMFTIYLLGNRNHIVTELPDVAIIPNTFELINNWDNVKIIKYSPEEEINLWEQF